MNLAETHALLTLIATLDRRRFDDPTVIAWQEILAEQPFDDCRTAVINHFRENTDYLMPVHVTRGAEQIDHDRRRKAREAAEHRCLIALESDPTRRDRSADIQALITQLRAALPPGNPDKLRRTEWLQADRRRTRRAEPNPHYDPAVAYAAATPMEQP